MRAYTTVLLLLLSVLAGVTFGQTTQATAPASATQAEDKTQPPSGTVGPTESAPSDVPAKATDAPLVNDTAAAATAAPQPDVSKKATAEPQTTADQRGAGVPVSVQITGATGAPASGSEAPAAASTAAAITQGVTEKAPAKSGTVAPPAATEAPPATDAATAAEATDAPKVGTKATAASTGAEQTDAPATKAAATEAAAASTTAAEAKALPPITKAPETTEAAPATTAAIEEDTNTTEAAGVKAVAVSVGVTTSQPETEATTAVPEVATTEAPVATTSEPEPACEPADSPCCTATKLTAEHRHVTNRAENEDEQECDKGMPAGWYSFGTKDKWSFIPTECIKEHHCGTKLGFHVHLEEDQELPTAAGDTLNATLAASMDILGTVECKVLPVKATVMRCADHFIYHLPALDRCNTGFCTVFEGEEVPYSVLADPPVTEPPPTTAAPTTEAPYELNLIYTSEMDDSHYDGAVTIEYVFTDENMNNDFLETFDSFLRDTLADKLNELKPNETEAPTTVAPKVKTTTEPKKKDDLETATVIAEDIVIGNEKAPEDKQIGPVIPDVDPDAAGARRKREAKEDEEDEEEEGYTADDVYYVDPSPMVKDGKMQVVVVVKEEDGSGVPSERVIEALDHLNASNELQTGPNLTLIGYYAGLPEDMEPAVGAVGDGRPGIWESHMGLFIAVIVLCGICLIVVIIGLLCIKCRGTGSWDPNDPKHPIAMEEGKKKHPHPNTVIENPLPDEEITKDEAPMQERENPSVSPNGSGQHLLKDNEDNGWVVPIDQAPESEKAKPEIETSKL